MVIDEGQYLAGKGRRFPGGAHYADDYMTCFLQGSTQYDALGHVWYDDQIWNGYDAKTTIGGLAKASVLPIAEKGVVGRGILLDMARFRGKDVLDVAETFTHEDLMACAEAQGVEIQSDDILIIRTGWIAKFYKVSPRGVLRQLRRARASRYSPELVQWFHDMEIPNLVTDTIANEVTVDPVSGVVLPLHNALMRNLGVTLTEIAWLDDLAADCAGRRPVHVPLHRRAAEGRQRHRRAGEPHRHQVGGDERTHDRVRGWRGTAPARRPTSHSAARAASTSAARHVPRPPRPPIPTRRSSTSPADADLAEIDRPATRWPPAWSPTASAGRPVRRLPAERAAVRRSPSLRPGRPGGIVVPSTR